MGGYPHTILMGHLYIAPAWNHVFQVGDCNLQKPAASAICAMITWSIKNVIISFGISARWNLKTTYWGCQDLKIDLASGFSNIKDWITCILTKSLISQLIIPDAIDEQHIVEITNNYAAGFSRSSLQYTFHQWCKVGSQRKEGSHTWDTPEIKTAICFDRIFLEYFLVWQSNFLQTGSNMMTYSESGLTMPDHQ